MKLECTKCHLFNRLPNLVDRNRHFKNVICFECRKEVVRKKTQIRNKKIKYIPKPKGTCIKPGCGKQLVGLQRYFCCKEHSYQVNAGYVTPVENF